MHPLFRASISGFLGLGLVAAPVAAQEDGVDRIDLPGGWAPEGITTDGSSLFVGSLADGAIYRADPMTGEGEILAAGAEGRVSAGIDHDAYGRLWVAGGPTGEVRVHDAGSGELLGTYPFESGFLNDVAATDTAVFVTDSFMPQVLVIPLGDAGALPDPGQAQALPLGGDLQYGEGFNVNGIVAAPAGLVVVHSAEGALYRVDPATGEAVRIETGEVDLTAGDGLELEGDTLYVVRNQANRIVAMELDASAGTATLLSESSAEDFDVPTTAAVVGDDLWAVNARFGTDVTPETEYWISRLDASGAMADAEMDGSDDMEGDDMEGDESEDG